MKKIRTAILGYGRNGSTMHAGAIERNEPFEMAAVCDVDPERREQAHARFGCTVYDNYREMLAKEALDLVCVITRSDQHAAMTCDCLAAGVNVLVTKPWAVNETEARRMIAAADASGRLLMPWLPSRWGSELHRLREVITEGAIGKVFLIRRAVCSFATRNDWQTERRCGGGYLLNWGPHIVDPPVLLAGSPVASVYARMKQTINPGDVEDVFFALMNLEDGTLVQAEYTVAVEDLPSWYVQGDHGTLVVRGNAMTVYKKTPRRPDDPTDYASMKADDQEVITETIGGAVYGDETAIYAEIAQAVLGQRPYPVRPADALELTRVFDALRTSATENRVVNL